MKINRWKISFYNQWQDLYVKNPTWLYTFLSKFDLFSFYMNDLSGYIVVLNFKIKWEKLFKK